MISTAILGPDLAVTVADSPDPVNVGEALSYTIDVSNTGGDAQEFRIHMDHSKH